ncbi:hypothetical protein GCM10027589_03890 [Actinocorallia lasiicapitis]
MARMTSRLRKTGVALLIGAATTSGAIALTSAPAEASCKYSYLQGGAEYGAYAYAETNDCSWISNSYARHGGTSISSGWYTGSSWARVDIGYNTSWQATNYFA